MVNLWTIDEIDFVKNNYGKLEQKEIAIILDRPWRSVASIIHRHKIKRSSRMRSKDPILSAWKRVMKSYISNAKCRHFEFNLTIYQFSQIAAKNCYFCGTEPKEFVAYQNDHDATKYLISQAKIYKNGVDRLDNTQGYSIDNCVACCTQCNLAKRMQTEQEFKIWIEKAYNHYVLGSI